HRPVRTRDRPHAGVASPGARAGMVAVRRRARGGAEGRDGDPGGWVGAVGVRRAVGDRRTDPRTARAVRGGRGAVLGAAEETDRRGERSVTRRWVLGAALALALVVAHRA